METRHPLSLPSLLRLASSFERSTGWSLLRYDANGDLLPRSPAGRLIAPRAAVMVDRDVVGYLGLCRSPKTDDPPCPAPPHELLRSIAELAGSWVTALKTARDSDEELASMTEITRSLTSMASPERIHAVLCEAAARELEASAAILNLVDETHETLRIAGAFPTDFLTAAELQRWQSPLSDSPADQEAIAGTALIIPCPRDDTRCRHWPAELRNRPGAAICVGLVANDRILGTLIVMADEDHEISLHSLRVLQGIANQGAFCIEQARLEQDSRIKKLLVEDLTSASEIQNALLPHSIPTFDNIELAVHRASYRAVGGDLHDFIAVDDDRLGLVIGDASGKGITGALMMATVRGGLHAYVRDVYNIEEIMRRLNVTINQATLGEYFMTLFYGVLNLKTLQFSYVNGGHNAPLWFHADRCTELEGGGTLLGADPQCQYHVSTVDLAPGDRIVFYTDGLAEAMDENGRMFRESRIQDAVSRDPSTGAGQILDDLLAAVTKFRGAAPLRDDMTVMVLKIRQPD